MSYSEEERDTTCGACGKVNHIKIAYSGDSRANEREIANCFNCGAEVASERCWVIHAAATAEEAEQFLRRVQNR